jgi:hypothetical protein
VQHTKPCSDCPFAREALPGWLAGDPPETWVRMAHGETVFECHTIIPQQCAGSAIYRANVCKRPPEDAIKLPADRERVFSNPMEFLAHHTPKVPQKKARRR